MWHEGQVTPTLATSVDCSLAPLLLIITGKLLKAGNIVFFFRLKLRKTVKVKSYLQKTADKSYLNVTH